MPLSGSTPASRGGSERVTRLTYRGVSVVLPDGEAIDELLARADESGVAQRLLGGLNGNARDALRKLFVAVYRAGVRDGVDRALDLALIEGVEPLDIQPDDHPPAAEPVVVRSPIQAVIERYRSSELRLPHPPEVGVRIGQVLASPDYEMEEVVDIIRRDVAITAKVMSLGASPVFAGGGRAPRTLNDAILRVGSRELNKYLLALGNRKLFNGATETAERALRDLWQHSLATAIMCEQLATEVEGAHPPSYFLHGLMHDIGRVVLVQIFDELQGEAAYAGAFTQDEIERTIDGLHGQFGAALLEKWRFAESFREVAMFHHQPQKSFAYENLVAATALADLLVCRMGFGSETSDWCDDPLEEHPCARQLGLDGDALEYAQQQMKRSYEAMADQL